jgi:hypothetical protein
VQLLGAENVAGERFGERIEQMESAPDPLGQGGALELHALPGVDLGLPVQGLVIGVLRDEDVSKQCGACHPAIDRPRWGLDLDDPLAARAGELGSDVADHPEVFRDVV